MNFLGSIFSIGSNIFGGCISGLVEGAIEGVGQLASSVTDKLECKKDAKVKGTSIDDENTTERKVAEEMGDIQMLVALDKEDRFIKSQEKEEEIKQKEEEEEKANKNEVKTEVTQIEVTSGLTLDNMVNQTANIESISTSDLDAAITFVEELTSDSETSVVEAETMRTFSSKKSEIDDAITKYESEANEEDYNENPFTLETQTDIYDQYNPIQTATENKEEQNEEYKDTEAETTMV